MLFQAGISNFRCPKIELSGARCLRVRSNEVYDNNQLFFKRSTKVVLNVVCLNIFECSFGVIITERKSWIH